VVKLFTAVTVVLAWNAPVPAVTVTVIPTARPVVDPTVIVVPDPVAPAVELYTGPRPR
jgi:hypothetical protein